MTNTPDETELPPSLRFLKGLVITLMITMIVGVITVVATLVTRMPKPNSVQMAVDPTQVPILPASITLPKDEIASAITYGEGWFGIVTTSQKILIYDKAGTLKQTIALTP